MKKFPLEPLLLCSTLISQSVVSEELTIDQLYLAPAVGYYLFDSKRDLDGTVFGSLAGGLMINPDWAVELAYAQLDTDHQYHRAAKDFDFEQYHLDGLYHLEANRRGLHLYLVAGVGNTILEYRNNTVDETHFNAGAGIKYHLTPKWKIRSDLRAYYGLDEEHADAAVTLSLAYQFGAGSADQRDFDSDGVNDQDDRCKNTQPGLSVDGKGCPNDDDNDDVTNHQDSCPDTGKGIQVDSQGCPLDGDEDSVANYRDKCPNTSTHVKVDRQGCPLDSDQDGVADYQDHCPDTVQGAKVDQRGCPLDEDRDGIPLRP